ncbi:hypothetical protein [Methylorubrum extorquens]|uniref:hypothetical protein n=1 Tax=Methylorubrum extorquens TaxID=408 RepID=UPI0018C89868|nr:hypothetical protein [Methylorubrum extorquens]
MDIRFSSFVLGMFGFLFFWSWATSTEGFCGIEYINNLAHKEGTNCLEFFINRYQTLITGILALTAAIITALVYYYQLKEMQKQSKLATASSAVSRYQAVLERIQQLPTVDEAAHRGQRIVKQFRCIGDGDTASDLRMNGSNIWKASEYANDLGNIFSGIVTIHAAGPTLIIRIDNSARACRSYAAAVSNIQQAILDISQKNTPITDSAANNLRDDFIAASDAFSMALDSLIEAHDNERNSLQEILAYLDEQITGR